MILYEMYCVYILSGMYIKWSSNLEPLQGTWASIQGNEKGWGRGTLNSMGSVQ